jgi:hypothetical protein
MSSSVFDPLLVYIFVGSVTFDLTMFSPMIFVLGKANSNIIH